MGVLAQRDVAYFNEKGTPICGAQRNNQPLGTRCQKAPVKGMLRCTKHGGKSLRGAAVPHYKDGRKSRYTGVHRLQERADAALADPEYLSMRPELALIDAMLAERWDTLEDGGNDDRWASLEKQFLDLRSAMESGDVRKTRSMLVVIEDVIEKGGAEALARQEIRELIKDRQRLAESMQKTMISLHQTVTVDQTIQMLQEVIHIVSGTVEDRKQVSEVMRKIMALTEAGGGGDAIVRREVVSV